MNVFCPPLFLAGIAVFSAGASLGAQSIKDEVPNNIPLRKITVYSSGVAFFEHSGTLQGPAALKFSFKTGAVNDALKSLIIYDPASSSPSVSYPSEQILTETLRSLSIDLSGNPGMAEILSGLRGEELEVSAPGPITGRITALEYRTPEGENSAEPWLSLLTAGGIRSINLRNIDSLRFTDPRIAADLGRALDLIAASRNSLYRDMTISLPGSGSRPVSVSYVIPAPVWKVSYRLDLSPASPAKPQAEALLQGWAIVDNDGGADWQDVELSLVTGRPVSFIQSLYPPYYVNRPILPLAIAGAAEAAAWDSGYGAEEEARKSTALRNSRAFDALAEAEYMEAPAPMAAASSPLAGGIMDTAQAASLGDQFAFTIKTPVSLNRQRSAMLPLVEGKIAAEKLLILSGRRALEKTVHPNLGAELTNATGMKLPAGPITVYDGGAYAGDALIEFFSPEEKRLVSWGEDLSVTASAAGTGGRFMSAVSISRGLMTINWKQAYTRTYTLKNASGEAKRVLIEHPITAGTELAEPASPAEKTASAYRFVQSLPAGGELVFAVREEQPVSNRISLIQQQPDTLVSYASNQEIPPNVRAALQKALDFKREADTAQTTLDDLRNRWDFLVSEQNRIRKNLEAAGSQSPQGQEYLRRLVQLDADIDSLNAGLKAAEQKARETQKGYEDYLGTLTL